MDSNGRLEMILIEVLPGELIDRISIWRLKSERLRAPEDLVQIRSELSVLERLSQEHIPASAALESLALELGDVNARLWQAEDRVRELELNQDFGPLFVGSARSIYSLNARRSWLKRRINLLLGLPASEAKSGRRKGVIPNFFYICRTSCTARNSTANRG